MTERQLRALRQVPVEQRAETLRKLIAEKPEIKEAAPFVPSGRELESKAKEIMEPVSVMHTQTQITCSECHLAFAIVHKERRGEAEHSLEQVIVA